MEKKTIQERAEAYYNNCPDNIPYKQRMLAAYIAGATEQAQETKPLQERIDELEACVKQQNEALKLAYDTISTYPLK